MSGLTEKLLNTWLTNVDERGLQHVFCMLLMRKGHRVVHSTVHNALELGKDIVSIDVNGKISAYQLKSTTSDRITQSDYRNDIQPQIRDLTTLAISIPGIKPRRPDYAYVVANAKFHEVVHRQILDYNASEEGCPLSLIGFEEIIQDLIQYGSDIWPEDVRLSKEFLELYMDEGLGELPAEKFGGILSGMVEEELMKSKGGKSSAKRLLSSLAIAGEIATNSWRRNDNQWASVQADCLLLMTSSYILEKHKLPERVRNEVISLYRVRINDSLHRFSNEASRKKLWQLVSTDELGNVGRSKLLHVTALMCLSSLFTNSPENKDECRKLIQLCQQQRYLFGEYAAPQALTIVFWLYRNDASGLAENWLLWLLDELISLTITQNRYHFPPWQLLDNNVAKSLLGLGDIDSKPKQTRESHWLDVVARISIRFNLKAHLKGCWPLIAQSARLSFIPEDPYDWLKYKINRGRNHRDPWIPPHNWSALIKSSQGEEPTLKLVKNDPLLFLVMLLVCPHRINSNWLLYHLRSICGDTWH